MSSKRFASSDYTFLLAAIVMVAWFWAIYRYSQASFIPMPEQGRIVEIQTKYGTRYVSKSDCLAFYTGLAGILFFALKGIVNKFSRKK